MRDPMALWRIPIDKKERYKVISYGLETFRNFINLDKENIKVDKIKGINKLKNVANFMFKRGFEYIEEYTCS